MSALAKISRITKMAKWTCEIQPSRHNHHHNCNLPTISGEVDGYWRTPTQVQTLPTQVVKPFNKTVENMGDAHKNQLKTESLSTQPPEASYTRGDTCAVTPWLPSFKWYIICLVKNSIAFTKNFPRRVRMCPLGSELGWSRPAFLDI